MQQADFWSGPRAFARDQDGSTSIALALFAVAICALAAMAVLDLSGWREVPRLVYLVFATAAVFSGWDAFRERRKARDDATGQ